jgi:hypothetical protein
VPIAHLLALTVRVLTQLSLMLVGPWNKMNHQLSSTINHQAPPASMGTINHHQPLQPLSDH